MDSGSYRGAARVVRAIDWVNEHVGRLVSWLVLAMVLTTFLVAALRYGASVGWIWMQEAYVWMHGVIIMVASGYTLLHDGHVRVDIFYRSRSPRYRAWVDLAGVFVFLLPMLAVVAWASWPYVATSWQRLERSQEAGGLPALYLLKGAILAFCILLALQGIALALRSYVMLRHGAALPSPKDPAPVKGEADGNG